MTDFLGYVAWYTVRCEGDDATLDVTREQLEAWFRELGLESTYIPRLNRSIDAFRTATTVTGEKYVSEDNLTYQLIVVERKRQPDLVVRHVMRQGLDAGAHTIRVATLEYFRARRTTAGRVRDSEDLQTSVHRGLRGVDLKVVKQFVADCLERYEAGRRQLKPHSVRVLLRGYLGSLGAVPIPCAEGAYFVPAEALQVTRALQELVSRCSSRSRMLLMPLVDEDEQRAMLQEAIDTDVDERARRAVANISQWRDRHPGQTPGPRTTGSWYDQCRRLQDLVGRYSDRYNMVFPAAADSLEDFSGAAGRMVGRVVAASRRS